MICIEINGNAFIFFAIVASSLVLDWCLGRRSTFHSCASVGAAGIHVSFMTHFQSWWLLVIFLALLMVNCWFLRSFSICLSHVFFGDACWTLLLGGQSCQRSLRGKWLVIILQIWPNHLQSALFGFVLWLMVDDRTLSKLSPYDGNREERHLGSVSSIAFGRPQACSCLIWAESMFPIHIGELAESVFRKGGIWSSWSYWPSSRGTIWASQMLLLPGKSCFGLQWWMPLFFPPCTSDPRYLNSRTCSIWTPSRWMLVCDPSVSIILDLSTLILRW